MNSNADSRKSSSESTKKSDYDKRTKQRFLELFGPDLTPEKKYKSEGSKRKRDEGRETVSQQNKRAKMENIKPKPKQESLDEKLLRLFGSPNVKYIEKENSYKKNDGRKVGKNKEPSSLRSVNLFGSPHKKELQNEKDVFKKPNRPPPVRKPLFSKRRSAKKNVIIRPVTFLINRKG